ncbi:hypothetical protein AMEX_G24564 [Astyanax mexicanus]|uniref:Uncharacterized protein n=1 Tax=Astyanax mexicanus TaxID=7994 RepID=A0A8T2KT31_ASTMX|nr:hypothetical protein AMEX_G24564 [Astyanax mexicanus]
MTSTGLKCMKMAAAAAAEAALSSSAFEYPKEIQSNEEKKQKHKKKVMRENPEKLWRDCTVRNNKSTTTNLQFYTERTTAWSSAISTHFPNTSKQRINHAQQIYIYEDEEMNPKNKVTVNIFHNGTVMVQGNVHALIRFEQAFSHLKALASEHQQQESENLQNLTPEPSPAPSSPVSSSPTPSSPTPSSPAPTLNPELINSFSRLDVSGQETKNN